MYCIDNGAIAFMFSGGSSYGLTIHPIDTKHYFLAISVHLCSTSLKDATWTIMIYYLKMYMISVKLFFII